MNIFYLFLLLLSFSAFSASKRKENLENFFKDKTKIDSPFQLRDPFKPPVVKKADNKRKGFTVTGKGQYSNVIDTPLEQIRINEIRLVGVLIGKERRALINLGKDGGKVIILKEGMKIGPDEAELKAILPGGIVLVEKIVNVYGEEEYLETVVPISK